MTGVIRGNTPTDRSGSVKTVGGGGGGEERVAMVVGEEGDGRDHDDAASGDDDKFNDEDFSDDDDYYQHGGGDDRRRASAEEEEGRKKNSSGRGSNVRSRDKNRMDADEQDIDALMTEFAQASQSFLTSLDRHAAGGGSGGMTSSGSYGYGSGNVSGRTTPTTTSSTSLSQQSLLQMLQEENFGKGVVGGGGGGGAGGLLMLGGLSMDSDEGDAERRRRPLKFEDDDMDEELGRLEAAEDSLRRELDLANCGFGLFATGVSAAAAAVPTETSSIPEVIPNTDSDGKTTTTGDGGGRVAGTFPPPPQASPPEGLAGIRGSKSLVDDSESDTESEGGIQSLPIRQYEQDGEGGRPAPPGFTPNAEIAAAQQRQEHNDVIRPEPRRPQPQQQVFGLQEMLDDKQSRNRGHPPSSSNDDYVLVPPEEGGSDRKGRPRPGPGPARQDRKQRQNGEPALLTLVEQGKLMRMRHHATDCDLYTCPVLPPKSWMGYYVTVSSPSFRRKVEEHDADRRRRRRRRGRRRRGGTTRQFGGGSNNDDYGGEDYDLTSPSSVSPRLPPTPGGDGCGGSGDGGGTSNYGDDCHNNVPCPRPSPLLLDKLRSEHYREYVTPTLLSPKILRKIYVGLTLPNPPAGGASSGGNQEDESRAGAAECSSSSLGGEVEDGGDELSGRRPLRAVSLRIRPDVLCGAVMDALSNVVGAETFQGEVLKRQGGHFRAILPPRITVDIGASVGGGHYMGDNDDDDVDDGDSGEGTESAALVMDAQLVTKRRGKECERILLVRIYDVPPGYRGEVPPTVKTFVDSSITPMNPSLGDMGVGYDGSMDGGIGVGILGEQEAVAGNMAPLDTSAHSSGSGSSCGIVSSDIDDDGDDGSGIADATDPRSKVVLVRDAARLLALASMASSSPTMGANLDERLDGEEDERRRKAEEEKEEKGVIVRKHQRQDDDVCGNNVGEGVNVEVVDSASEGEGVLVPETTGEGGLTPPRDGDGDGDGGEYGTTKKDGGSSGSYTSYAAKATWSILTSPIISLRGGSGSAGGTATGGSGSGRRRRNRGGGAGQETGEEGWPGDGDRHVELEYPVCSSVVQGGRFPSLSNEDSPLVRSGHTFLLQCVEELETRELTYVTLSSCPFGGFPALPTLDAQYCSQIRFLIREHMIVSLLKTAAELEQFAREQSEYLFANLVDMVRQTYVQYEVEEPPLPQPVPLTAYPLDYVPPELSCPPWGQRVMETLNEIASESASYAAPAPLPSGTMANREGELERAPEMGYLSLAGSSSGGDDDGISNVSPTTRVSSKPAKDTVDSYKRARNAVSKVVSAFQRQDDEEQGARLGRKNVQVMDRLAKFQAHKRALILTLRDSYGSNHSCTKAADEFHAGAVLAVKSGRAYGGIHRPPGADGTELETSTGSCLDPFLQVPVFKCGILMGGRYSTGTCFVTAYEILFVTQLIPLLGGMSRYYLVNIEDVDLVEQDPGDSRNSSSSSRILNLPPGLSVRWKDGRPPRGFQPRKGKSASEEILNFVPTIEASSFRNFVDVVRTVACEDPNTLKFSPRGGLLYMFDDTHRSDGRN